MSAPQRHHERQSRRTELGAEVVDVAVGGIGHRGPEPDAEGGAALRQLGGDAGFGAETRVVLALREVVCRGAGHRVQRVVDALVGPQRGHRDDAVVGLADPAQPLAAHMRGRGTVLTVSVSRVRFCGWVRCVRV
nr:hypothetical protein [Nocardia terpenica]